MGRSPEIAPLDGPAPIPSPHVLADRESSATACAAAVEPPSVRVVPPSVSSVLKRTARANGGLTKEGPRSPGAAPAPPGSDATEPENSAVQSADLRRMTGGRARSPMRIGVHATG